MLGQHLQRHVPVELRVPRLPDFAHAALADLGGDFIRAEVDAGCKRHGYGTGTRALSSSTQFWTTTTFGPVPASLPGEATRSALMRNR